MDAETFWGVLRPLLLIAAILGLPRWGAARWLSFSATKKAALLLLGVGLFAAAIPAYFEGRRSRRTVFARRIPGPAQGAPADARRTRSEALTLTSAGAAHRLSFGPIGASRDPQELSPVTIGLVVLDPGGRPLASYEQGFHAEPSEVQEGVYRFGTSEQTFTPREAGVYRLVARFGSGGAPDLWVQVEDLSR